MKKINLFIGVSTLVWLIMGIYGIIFNITYIDEAKYLIKGWLILTGQVGYYSTPGFFYQHMPGGLLWYGLGQKLFGPNLLVGRVQSWLVGLAVFYSSYCLSRKLSGKKGAVITLMLLSLVPVIGPYYSETLPQSLSALMLVLGFLYFYDGWVKENLVSLSWATVWFSLAFVVRENFLFTWIIYLLLISWKLRGNFMQLVWQWMVALTTVGLFILPGWPGTIEVLRNFPGVSRFLPVSPAEREILGLFWRKEFVNDWMLRFRAIASWGIIFHAWAAAVLAGLLLWWKNKKIKWFKSFRQKEFLLILLGITLMNTLAHAYSAFKLSPRAIVSYSSYVAPLWAVLLSFWLAKLLKPSLEKKLFLGYILFLPLIIVGIKFSNISSLEKLWLLEINQSAEKLKPLVENYHKIIWINEPTVFFLAGKVSYYPLINHTNFYKNSNQTETVRNLGFWNLEMLDQWFDEADLVVIGNNKIKLLNESSEGVPVAKFIEKRLTNDFKIKTVRSDIWPDLITFYEPLVDELK